MNENNSVIHQKLELHQQNIIKQIKRSHQLIVIEFILSALLAIGFIVFLIIASIITNQPRKIAPILIYPLYLIIVFVINYSRYRPFYKKTSTQFKQIKEIDTESNELMSTKQVFGIASYVNSIYDLYKTYIVINKQKEPEDVNREEDLKKLFRIRSIVDLIILAVFIAALIAIIILTIAGEVSIPWLYIVFSVGVSMLTILTIISFHTRASIRNWMSIFRILDVWGTMIEEDQSLADFEEYSIG
ncbi:MAG: hypothetical protein FK733_00890 [Asgard group archaeon]|nr:hypothetical protein [Asgard group archaeon]